MRSCKPRSVPPLVLIKRAKEQDYSSTTLNEDDMLENSLHSSVLQGSHTLWPIHFSITFLIISNCRKKKNRDVKNIK